MATNNNFFTSSPTVVIPATSQTNGYFNGPHYAEAAIPGHVMNVDTPVTPGGSVLATTPGALAGRKRSRGDIHAPEEEEQGLGDGSIDTPIGEAPANPPRGKPLYGPGMTLVYPEDPSYAALAESQSGTWVEENKQRQQFQLNHMKRPSISTRKSQRVDASASAPDDLAQLVLPPQMREVTAEPLIDEATRVLGISWVRMDSTDVHRINSAASAKWVQKHYPNLQEVAVWFEYSALPCYLVQALNGHSGQREYYLFSQDLKEARLVTSDPTQLVPRLKMLPALELAAPGGAVLAQADPTPVATAAEGTRAAPSNIANDPNAVKTLMAEDDYMIHGGPLRGFCSAHEMEMD